MSVTVRIGESVVTGYVGGVWSVQDKEFAIKRGKTKNDKKYQIFSIKVSSKDKESGAYTNGKDIEVMLFGDTKIEEGQALGLVGRFQPNNYTNGEGKEVRGNQFLAFEDGIFTPDSWDTKPEGKKQPAETPEDEIAW